MILSLSDSVVLPHKITSEAFGSPLGLTVLLISTVPKGMSLYKGDAGAFKVGNSPVGTTGKISTMI